MVEKQGSGDERSSSCTGETEVSGFYGCLGLGLRGGHLDHMQVQGVWNETEKLLHILRVAQDYHLEFISLLAMKRMD